MPHQTLPCAVKKFLSFLFLLAIFASAQAKIPHLRFFHFGVGANAGTNGLGLDASIGLGRFVQVRAGYTFGHPMAFERNVGVYDEASAIVNAMNINNPDFSARDYSSDVKVRFKPHLNTAHALVDIYPLGRFHITAGAYFGQQTIVELTSSDPIMKTMGYDNLCIMAYNEIYPGLNIQPIGLEVGGHVFAPDATGNLRGEMRVQKVRPYVGIGWGRAVPRRSRIGCSFDLGVQYWGKPEYYCNGEPVLTNGESESGLWKTLGRSPVYPVVTLRLCGRLL